VGIDAGSAAVKALAFGGGRPLAWLKEPTRPDISGQCARLLSDLCARPALSGMRRQAVCATGYGRGLAREADLSVSEIMAGALGTGWIWRQWDKLEGSFGAAPHPRQRPDPFRTILDIGGQDSKVITFTADHMLDRFAMNDRCAAGTGRFLEVMARVLELDLAGMNELALQARSAARISSACTVFAQSEVISLLSDGVARSEIAAGVFESVAQQLVGLVHQVGLREPVMLAGGAALSTAMWGAVKRALGCQVAVPPCAEFTTALGAAIHAEEEVTGAH
jgi:predicted CoA-substrate-specific enzyme activase